MRADQDFDPQAAEETELLNDPEFVRWADALNEDTRRAIDAAHASCSIDNPLGLCGECEAVYRKAKKIGAEDYRMGIDVVRGMAVFMAFHPELPRVGNGAIDGYNHGYSTAMLCSLLSCGFQEGE